MATFRLPDGKVLNIPDDPNQRQQIADAIQQIPEYGPEVAKEYLEGTLSGQALEFAKNIPRGAATSTISGLRGIADLLAQDSLGLDGPAIKARDKLKQIEENVYENVGGEIDPRYSENFSTKAGMGLGSIIPYAALGRFGASRPGAFAPYATPGSTGIKKLLPSKEFLKTPTFQYPAALGIGQSISETSDKMRIARDEYGEDIGFVQETLGTLTGGLVGASEALPIFNFFKNIPKSALRDATTSQQIANYARNFGTGAVQEGLQEATAGLARDLTAKGFFSNELPIGDSVWDDLTVGGFAGGVLNTVMNYAAGRRGIASEYRAEKEKRAEKNKQDLLKTKKFDIAQQAGTIDIVDPTLEGEQETLLLPDLTTIPTPVEITTEPQLQIINNPDNTFTLRDISAIGRNNVGEINTFNSEADALVAKQEFMDSFDVNNQRQVIENDLYSLGLINSRTGFEIGQTLKDKNTTSVDLKEIVTNDSSLKDAQAMQNVLMGKNKKYKTLPIQDNYTFSETKKILSAADFNKFTSETAKQVSLVAEEKGYKPVIDKTKPNITLKKLKEVAESKNIDLEINSPAVEYAAQMYTGTNKFKSMSKGQKELFLARLQSLPRFNNKIKFPDFRPRDYSAEDVAEFVANVKVNNMTFNKKSLQQINRSDQFLDDLIYSGRAEKIGKTQNYKIRDNFETDIAARTEGFDETVEEFNSRLNTDSILAEEEIANLTEEESITQSKPLSIEEQNKQTIDFAEAVQEGKLNKFAKELKNRLNKLGLKETGVVVSNDILSSETLIEQEDGSIAYDPRRAPAEGEYDRNTDIIFLSLNNINPDGKATDAQIEQRLNAVLDHEMIHALREKDLITEKEYDYLKKQVKKVRVPKAFDAESFAKKETFYTRAERINKITFEERANRGIIDSTISKNELYAEEAIAEMYRARGFRSPLPPRAEGIYNKIVEFFSELGDSLRISGYANVSEVFADIESGQVGARERGEIRTTKLLDKGPGAFVIDQELEDTPTFARGERDESSGHVADYVPAQYGPPAHQLDIIVSDEKTKDGYYPQSYGFRYPKTPTTESTTKEIQEARKEFEVYSTARTQQEQQEEREFINKLMEIKGNPNAIITMYQAAPQRDLREGDIITPFLSDAQYYIDESKITPEEVKAADRARRRQEQIDKTGAVDLNQERLFNQMDGIMDVFGTPQTTPSTIHTYKLRAADIRWDGNNGWARWGYFPRIKAVEDVPTFSRVSDIKNKYLNEDIKLDIFETENEIKLSKIVVSEKNMGVGTSVMNDLTNYADNNNKVITLTPSKDFGATSVNRLKTFYKRFGFVENKGRNKDFSYRDTMYRLPQISQDIPTFSRESDDAYFAREKKNQRISNLESIIYSKKAQLSQERGSMTDATARRLEKEIRQHKNEITELRAGDLPTFSRGQRFDDGSNTQENIQLRKAVEEVEELTRNTARGGIPTYNLNASDVALKAALDFNKDLSSKEPGDIPTFSRPGFDGVDPDIVEGINRTGSKTSPENSMGYRFIDEVKDNISPRLKYFFNNFRTQFVDKLDKIDKLIVKAKEDNEKVRRANNTADTATLAALRMADKARGIFQGMLTKGYVDSVIEGVPSLSNTVALKISTKYNKFLEGDTNTGGLMQILAPLYGTSVDKESIFKYYAMAKRTQGFDNRGKVVDSPVKQKDIQNIKKIEQQYPEVVEAYNNYQLWNGKLIDFATNKGILSKTRSTNELAEDISNLTKEDVKELEKLSYDELMNRVLELNKKLPIPDKIETRGTAQIWKENSDYYPFYRKMADETANGPRIASGSLPNNPLDIKLTGSEKAVDVDVIEAISRNSLSILTAALKNDGVAKLVRDLQELDMARPITPKQAGKLDSIFVFENGIKQHYQVKSIETFEALTAIGGTPTGFWTTLVGAPAGLLRDTVTRDPGFVAINILRDTMSTMVTSGANYTPIVDSVKNMFKDMHELERFGVLGGYDFANDEGSVKRYLSRTMRQQGYTEENGMSASGAFFKLWDGLGALTTKSDGATRLAVYNSVYDKLISEGYNEAQAQSDAAFQALEIINFGRRGLNPGFRFITAAIPFLNARVQGLDVLWRGSTGQYSAVERLGENQSIKDIQKKIQTNMLVNATSLVGITLAYYLMYHDDEEYKNLKREVRDDNWVFPVSKDYAIKVPIPFEVGLLFKVVPERFFDMTLGDDAFTKKSLNEAATSIGRGAQTSLNVPLFQPGGGFQVLKPIAEAINNKNTFTGTEIVPYYQQKKEAGLQSRPTTNYLIKNIGEFLNISPSKVEHVVRGYTGSLGAHVLNVIDMTARGVTGEPILPSNVSLGKIPVLNRLLLDIDKSSGYQQQFYELRNEVDRAVQTMNSLKKAGRYDELLAYRSNMQGVLNVQNQVRKINRYLTKWRLRRDAIMSNPNMSLTAKSDALRELELERDKRLAFVPEMRKKADVPFININMF